MDWGQTHFRESEKVGEKAFSVPGKKQFRTKVRTPPSPKSASQSAKKRTIFGKNTSTTRVVNTVLWLCFMQFALLILPTELVKSHHRPQAL